MQQKQCCPKDSWPRLKSDYQPKGQIFEVANTTCYHIGSGSKVLLMVSDIFGASSGTHQAFADTFANFGYNVYLPQILTKPYHENQKHSMMQTIKSQKLETMKQRFKGIIEYLKQKGHKKIFIVSFCWGVWFSFKMATQYEQIICIVGMHPALNLQESFGGKLQQLTNQIKCPAYLFPAGNDQKRIKPGGQIVQILKKRFGQQKSGSHQFPDMKHGWTVRGDIKDNKVKRDTAQAIQMCRKYFERFQ